VVLVQWRRLQDLLVLQSTTKSTKAKSQEFKEVLGSLKDTNVNKMEYADHNTFTIIRYEVIVGVSGGGNRWLIRYAESRIIALSAFLCT